MITLLWILRGNKLTILRHLYFISLEFDGRNFLIDSRNLSINIRKRNCDLSRIKIYRNLVETNATLIRLINLARLFYFTICHYVQSWSILSHNWLPDILICSSKQTQTKLARKRTTQSRVLERDKNELWLMPLMFVSEKVSVSI